MNIKDITSICSNIASSYGYSLDIPVEINNRIKKTLGRVTYRRQNGRYEPIKIEFSSELIKSGNKELIIDTIKHEMAHYFVLKDTGERHNHDSYWKNWAIRLGCRPSASIRVYDNREENYKYKVVCSHCNKTIGLYKRASKVIKNPWRYRSSCCNAKVDVYINTKK